jgi:hypothetical protein
VGAHLLTAEVTDSGGLVAQATVALTINAAPGVAITSPADGSQFVEGEVVSLTGTASDAEDGDLGASIAWSSSLDGALGTGPSLALPLSPGAHILTAQVTDSGGLVAQATVAVTVNGAPSVSITSPADGSQFGEGSPVLLTGTASDAEDGDLDASIAWSSSLDGALGTGAALAPVLSVGAHIVTAQVTDSGGLVAQATIAVTVNGAPSVSITSPVDGSQFDEDEVVSLTGTASDAEDGDLSAALVWSSSLDGALGTGAALALPLSPGAHVLTVQVTDTGGLVAQATIALTVNGAPSVSITSPADGSLFAEGSAV